MKRNTIAAGRIVLLILTLSSSIVFAKGPTTLPLSPVPPAPRFLPRQVQPLQPIEAAPSGPPARIWDDFPAYRPNQVLVKFHPGVQKARIHTLTRGDVRISKSRRFQTLSRRKGQEYFLLTSASESAEALRERLLRDPTVAEVSFNYAKTIQSTTPNDPYFPFQWALHNTGQVFKTGASPGTPDVDIDGPEAWDLDIGDGDVVVAVLDTGIAYDHPDLVNNLWTNAAEENGFPGVDDDGNGYVDDIFGIDTGQADTDPLGSHWHGTHVTGTIAAQSDNGIGVAGINWNGKVIALKLSASDGRFYTDAEIEGFEYLVDLKERGVNIVAANASYGGGDYDPFTKDAIAMLGEAGIILVAAAGNYGQDNDVTPLYPASYDLGSIISVVATDCNDQVADFSNYGLVSTDLGAPGVDVLSTSATIAYTPAPGDTFFDDLEFGPGQWYTAGPWAITQEVDPPNHVWSDSPGGNYAPNGYTSVVSEPMDLAADRTTTAPFELQFKAMYELEADRDFLDVLFYAPPRSSYWQRTQERAKEGTWAWSDSPGGYYPANAHSWLASPVIDLSAADSGAILSFANTGYLEPDNDQMRIYLSKDGGATWSWMAQLSGNYSDRWYGWYVAIGPEYRTSQFRFAFVLDTNNTWHFDGYYVDDVAVQDSMHTIANGNPIFHDGAETTLPGWEQPQRPDWEHLGSVTGSSAGAWKTFRVVIEDWFIWDQFRCAFALNSDAVNQFDGVYLDDLGVGIPTMDAHTYVYSDGTSMAAPHVSGAVALVAAQHPYESVVGRIHRILAGVESVPALAGKTATGGRLNLVGALLATGFCEGNVNPVVDTDVDGSELAVLVAEFDTFDCGAGAVCQMDLDHNGRVDGFDLGIFAADFGQVACP